MAEFEAKNNHPFANVTVDCHAFRNDTGHVYFTQDGHTVGMSTKAFREIASWVLAEIGDTEKCGAVTDGDIYICTLPRGHSHSHREIGRDGCLLARWQ